MLPRRRAGQANILRNDPAFVEAERARKKAEKKAAHEYRLVAKAVRDAARKGHNMNFLIADTFTASFNRLSGMDQKAVKASVFDLQMDRSGPGLQLHRIENSKDPNFWSARVNRGVPRHRPQDR